MTTAAIWATQRVQCPKIVVAANFASRAPIPAPNSEARNSLPSLALRVHLSPGEREGNRRGREYEVEPSHSERLREHGRGYRRRRSQADSEDHAHLIISFAFGVGGLGEGGNSGEPAITAIGNVWTNEEIVLGFGAVPGGQKNLVQHFGAH